MFYAIEALTAVQSRNFAREVKAHGNFPKWEERNLLDDARRQANKAQAVVTDRPWLCRHHISIRIL